MQQPPPAGALPDLTSDDKTWAALSHATILLGVLSGGPLGPLAAFAIWLSNRTSRPTCGARPCSRSSTSW